MLFTLLMFNGSLCFIQDMFRRVVLLEIVPYVALSRKLSAIATSSLLCKSWIDVVFLVELLLVLVYLRQSGGGLLYMLPRVGCTENKLFPFLAIKGARVARLNSVSEWKNFADS